MTNDTTRESASIVLVVGAAVSRCALFAPSSAPAISSSGCDNRVNDTPRKLVECIQTADLWNHMQAFQAIADANPSPADGHPSRNSGEPGYKASADYVAKVMTDAGYNVTIQPYKFTYYAYISRPTMRRGHPTVHDYVLATDWNPGQSTGTAPAVVSRPEASCSRPLRRRARRAGATAADFSGFTSGRIALIQRGDVQLRREGAERPERGRRPA